jgi:uncharacterized membrane protein YoaK (UPF0700 family)
MATDDAQRIRDGLLVVLALATGATDATAFERLNHVFASVIIGNGVFVAAPRHEREQPIWPRSATVALGLARSRRLIGVPAAESPARVS